MFKTWTASSRTRWSWRSTRLVSPPSSGSSLATSTQLMFRYCLSPIPCPFFVVSKIRFIHFAISLQPEYLKIINCYQHLTIFVLQINSIIISSFSLAGVFQRRELSGGDHSHRGRGIWCSAGTDLSFLLCKETDKVRMKS